MTVGAVVLYSVVDGLLSKDNYMSAIVVTVIQIGVTKVHFGIIGQWCILQNIMDRAVDILLPSSYIGSYIFYPLCLTQCFSIVFVKFVMDMETMLCTHTHCNSYYFL